MLRLKLRKNRKKLYNFSKAIGSLYRFLQGVSSTRTHTHPSSRPAFAVGNPLDRQSEDLFNIEKEPLLRNPSFNHFFQAGPLRLPFLPIIPLLCFLA